MSFPTEFTFTLPRGYRETLDGPLYRQGRMRLATALDEIQSVQDPRVQANEAFLPVLLLSRVIELDQIGKVTPEMVASFFVIDLVYLEDLYERINSPEEVTLDVVCPACQQQIQVQVAPLGG